jgi:hypothetical protein
VVDGDGRHVAVIELFVLVVAENHDGVQVGTLEHLAKLLDRCLSRGMAALKDLGL